jgi:hypothetical protein
MGAAQAGELPPVHVPATCDLCGHDSDLHKRVVTATGGSVLLCFAETVSGLCYASRGACRAGGESGR